MRKLTPSTALLALVALGAAACSVTSNTTNTTPATLDGGTDSGGGGVDGAADGGSSLLGFTPSNIDLSGFDLSSADDVIISGGNCPIDSEAADGPMFFVCSQDANNRVVHKIITLADQSRLSVFVMKSLRIEASTVWLVNRGHLPVVIVALDKMELLGSIDVAPGTTGGFFDGTFESKGLGQGGGTAGDSTGLAGGGGSYCGLGGKAGTLTASAGTAASAPTPAYGTPQLVPLLPGSAGGSAGLTNSDGSGGGALQLVAGNAFTLHAGAYVNVGGGGGIFGGLGKDGSGGGGSGGALLIESKVVTIQGVLAANGGGGGQGNGDQGEVGHPDQVAQGGHKVSASAGAAAGNGSFADAQNASDGPSSADPSISAGGGGGGAGRIRINSSSGQAAVTGTVTPSTTTGCMTEGKVAN